MRLALRTGVSRRMGLVTGEVGPLVYPNPPLAD